MWFSVHKGQLVAKTVEKIQHYHGTNKPSTADYPAKRIVQRLSILALTVVSLKTARTSDFKFFKQMLKNSSSTPQYGGIMKKCAQEFYMDISSINSIVYSPLLNMKPADHETIITVMYEAKRLTQSWAGIHAYSRPTTFLLSCRSVMGKYRRDLETYA